MLVAYVLSAGFASGHALINRPTPRSALLWITCLWVFPFLAFVAYLLLGIDRINRRALLKGRTREELRRLYPGVPALQRDYEEEKIGTDRLHEVHLVAGRLSGRPLLRGNDFQLLQNGGETFSAMIADIEKATSSINLMTYILDEDRAGHELLRALSDAAGRGVPTRVLYDAAGCVRTPAAFIHSARERGVHMEPFFPLNPLSRRAQLNLRNHRKILTVDGQVGYFGGINISARHYHDDVDNPGRCIDLHVRGTGPVVHQLQTVFAEDWYFAVGEELLSARHFPGIDKVGRAYGRVITSGPDEEQQHFHLLLFTALGAARDSIQLVTPYFVPDPAFLFALRSAALRGVRTEVYLPCENDHPFIKRAAYANLRPLVEAGVEVFEMAAPFVHAKAYVIDEEWALMGSANLDSRSFWLNYEVMVEMSNSKLLGDLGRWIADMRTNSEQITAQILRKRTLRQRLVDHFCNLFGPVL